MIYILWSSDFALYLEEYFMYKHYTFYLLVSMIQSLKYVTYLPMYYPYAFAQCRYDSGGILCFVFLAKHDSLGAVLSCNSSYWLKFLKSYIS